MWIKIEHPTPDKSQVGDLADLLKITRDAALGMLVRLWIWADQHVTSSGYTRATEAEIDYHAKYPGAAASLEKIGWLTHTKFGLRFVRFDEHNGETAKQRALTARRVAKHKRKSLTLAALPDRALPRGDKRREDKRREEENKKKQPPAAVAAEGQVDPNDDLIEQESGTEIEGLPETPDMDGQAPPAAPAPKARDVGWDILVGVFGFPARPAPGQQEKEMGGLAKQFNALGATEAETRRRWEILPRWLPTATATVRSLLKHWPELGAADIEEQIQRRESGGNSKPRGPQGPRALPAEIAEAKRIQDAAKRRQVHEVAARRTG